jgi:anti-sigma factor RsiW
MNVTRDIIMDLLPVYVSGEASADTRRLVEEFLEEDPDLGRLATSLDLRTDPFPKPDLDLPAGLERRALERTRSLLRQRAWILATALLCTLLPFSMAYIGDHIAFLMFRDIPASRLLWLVAAGLWLYYVSLRRATRHTQL